MKTSKKINKLPKKIAVISSEKKNKQTNDNHTEKFYTARQSDSLALSPVGGWGKDLAYCVMSGEGWCVQARLSLSKPQG